MEKMHKLPRGRPIGVKLGFGSDTESNSHDILVCHIMRIPEKTRFFKESYCGAHIRNQMLWSTWIALE